MFRALSSKRAAFTRPWPPLEELHAGAMNVGSSNIIPSSGWVWAAVNPAVTAYLAVAKVGGGAPVGGGVVWVGDGGVSISMRWGLWGESGGVAKAACWGAARVRPDLSYICEEDSENGLALLLHQVLALL